MIRLIAAFSMVFSLVTTASYADTIADWTFETSKPTTAGPLAPEVGSATASALGHHTATSTYSTPVGNGSSNSWSSNQWSVGDYWQFTVSTAGDSNIGLSWDQTSSGTGPKDFSLMYSVNGGSTFQTAANYNVYAGATFASGTYNSAFTLNQNLSSISALNGQASVIFRLVDLDTNSETLNGTVGTAGTDRVDNFTVSDNLTPVPLPAGVWLLGSGLAALVGARRRKETAAA